MLPISLSSFGQVVIPSPFANTDGGTFASPFRYPWVDSTFQEIVSAGELGTLTAGQQITGLAFRMDHGVAVPSPAAPAPFTDFTITLGQAALAPGPMSFTFANNFASSQVVRSGAFSIPTTGYPIGSNPNNFGPVITFDTPFTYTGGDLVIEIRSSGSATFMPEVDSDSNQNTVGFAGYQNGYAAMASTSSTATVADIRANAPIVQLTVVPEPATSALAAGLSLGAFALVRRQKRSARKA